MNILMNWYSKCDFFGFVNFLIIKIKMIELIKNIVGFLFYVNIK